MTPCLIFPYQSKGGCNFFFVVLLYTLSKSTKYLWFALIQSEENLNYIQHPVFAVIFPGKPKMLNTVSLISVIQEKLTVCIHSN